MPHQSCKCEDVIVIGAGAAGLAAASELVRRQVACTVLEQSDRVGASWVCRHPQLQLNTHRLLSGLPGWPIPKSAGPFPGRDAYVAYLEAFAERMGVRPVFGVTCKQLFRDGANWLVQTNAGIRRTHHVVVATGFDRLPHIPQWPGADRYEGQLIHASRFGRAERYAGKRVLVVGAGNSGTDVINHLAGVGVERLWVSVRHGPTVIPKRLFKLPLQISSPFLAMLPVAAGDLVLNRTERVAFGNLAGWGLPKHPDGAVRRLSEHAIAPAIDDGFIAALKSGLVEVVREVTGFDRCCVQLADGEKIAPDIIVCATGYKTGLDPIVGHLGILDDLGRPSINGAEQCPACPGLWFTGMRPAIDGTLRAAGRAGRKIARSIDRTIRTDRHAVPRLEAGCGAANAQPEPDMP